MPPGDGMVQYGLPQRIVATVLDDKLRMLQSNEGATDARTAGAPDQ